MSSTSSMHPRYKIYLSPTPKKTFAQVESWGLTNDGLMEFTMRRAIRAEAGSGTAILDGENERAAEAALSWGRKPEGELPS